ncbi:MAG: hypothetical protein HDR28_01945 [Lachnospiraceae bacterium]|nr:hypothetical protein [Lachnospiraceae bacterium]
MEELEFSRELVKILDKRILQMTLKKAVTQGFTVQGFNKNVWMAPVAIVNAAFEKRKRGGKYQYKIFLECLAGLEEDNVGINLAKKWLKNGEERAEAEKKLLELMSYKRKEKNIKIDEVKEAVSNGTSEKNGKKSENVDVIIQQQERIRKLQNTVQEFRISTDNYKKEIEHLQKKSNKLERRYEEERKRNNELLEEIEKLEKQIGVYQQHLAQKEEKIIYYKEIFEKAPKIICFSKKKIDNQIFPFQKIEQKDEWRNEFAAEIDWQTYQEVWIVESDFSYPEVMDIRKMADGKVVCARNLKSLITKVGGIK